MAMEGRGRELLWPYVPDLRRVYARPPVLRVQHQADHHHNRRHLRQKVNPIRPKSVRNRPNSQSEGARISGESHHHCPCTEEEDQVGLLALPVLRRPLQPQINLSGNIFKLYHRVWCCCIRWVYDASISILPQKPSWVRP